MEINHARGYIMALMVFIQNLHVLNCRSEHKSIFKNSIKENPLVIFSIISSIILQVIIMEVEPLSELLSTHSVPYEDLIKLILAAIPIIIVMEVFKKINKIKEKKN
jgi:magnesium-transporting ATPase (P-type)